MSRYLRIAAVALAVCLLIPSLFIFPARASEPGLSGECACLYLPQIDKVLVDKNGSRRHPMASTTKIMTALVALESAGMDDEVVVSPEAAGVEGSSIYLVAGERQTMGNLLYALLLESANDAAAAIAIHVAGSVSAFADKMNARAAEMGLTDTHFENPHGLSDDNHYTTAIDLARITAEAMRNPIFREIVSTKHKIIKVQNGTQVRSLSNHNRLLRSYDDCVGVKTGFTRISGRCLVSAAERNGMLEIAVTLDAPNDWQDHAALLDYGFSLYEGRILAESADERFTVPLIGGEQEALSLSARNTYYAVVARGSEPIIPHVEINRLITAPVRKGQVLGCVRYTQGGKTIATVPLLAEEAVAARPVRLTLWDKIKNFLKW